MKFPLVCLICAKKSRTLIFKIPPPPHCFENFLSPKIQPKFGDSPPPSLKKKDNKLCYKYMHFISIYFECRWTKNSKKKIPASEKQYPLPNDLFSNSLSRLW